MSVRTDLKGARWSSATRCIARAEHEALGSPRDDEAQTFLQDAFVRGVSAADAWVDRQRKLTLENGKTLIPEFVVAWGPEEFGWEGHADAVIVEDKLVIEAYHAKGGTFRKEKALQAAGYAHQMGKTWRAMLAVLDTTDVTEDGGFHVTYYPLEVEALAVETDEIMRKVSTAALAGKWNPEHRVADNPGHNECRNCPFRATCWEDYVPELPVFTPELDDLATRLAAKQSERAHAKATCNALDEEVDDLRAQLRPFVPAGTAVIAGGVQIKRIETAPRRTFRFAAYEGAGNIVTPSMLDFMNEASETGERWYVGKPAA